MLGGSPRVNSRHSRRFFPCIGLPDSFAPSQEILSLLASAFTGTCVGGNSSCQPITDPGQLIGRGLIYRPIMIQSQIAPERHRGAVATGARNNLSYTFIGQVLHSAGGVIDVLHEVVEFDGARN